MTLILTPLAEARLRALAAQKEQTPEAMLETLLKREESAAIPEVESAASAHNNPLLALFDEWDEEDRTDDPEELSRRNSQWGETKASLEANRLALRDVSHLPAGEEAA